MGAPRPRPRTDTARTATPSSEPASHASVTRPVSTTAVITNPTTNDHSYLRPPVPHLVSTVGQDDRFPEWTRRVILGRQPDGRLLVELTLPPQSNQATQTEWSPALSTTAQPQFVAIPLQQVMPLGIPPLPGIPLSRSYGFERRPGAQQFHARPHFRVRGQRPGRFCRRWNGYRGPRPY